MAIEAVVFDVDGVLVHAGVFGTILDEQYGVDRDSQAAFFRGPFRECVLGKADLRHAIAPFLKQWSWAGSVDDLLQVWFNADARVNDEVLDIVGLLRRKGRRCYVASTQEGHRAAYLEEVMGLGTRFDGLFFSCRVGRTKGDPLFYEFVSAEIGLQPQEILFFDDAEVIVEAARGARWNAEVYAFGDDLVTTLARYDLIVSSDA